jgi:hypothetical protein
MPDRKWRFRLGAFALTFLFLVMSGMARATTLTVTTTADAGLGSLRAAIASANTTPAVASTINFSVSGTITLASTLPPIANTSPGSLTIDGTGQAVTVDGASAFQIFLVNPGATLNLHNLTVAHGSFIDGGAINNFGTLTITNSTFSGNIAADGGGILNNGGTLTVTKSTFSGNVGISFGAGIANAAGTLTVTDSTFSGNGAFKGGGIDNFLGTLTVLNSTFSGNIATTFGAGIENEAGTLSVTNGTFFNNSAGDGADIFNADTASLKGTILAASRGGNCSGFSDPAVTDAGFNISDDASCGFSGTSVNNSTTLNLDPLGLRDNGGPTQTIALEATSQAVDFIPVANCTDQSSPTPLPLTTDQRGFARPDAGNPNFCDAGAYELLTSPDFALNSEKIQIAHSVTGTSDTVNMALTFTHLFDPDCALADDALHAGIMVQLFAGSCSDLMGTGLTVDLSPFAVRKVNGTSYGTIFQMFPPETVSGRIVALQTPPDTCGKWTLNLEVAGLNLGTIGLGGPNPFALTLTDSDLHGFACFHITDAIVGAQIPTSTPKVRRGVRR